MQLDPKTLYNSYICSNHIYYIDTCKKLKFGIDDGPNLIELIKQMLVLQSAKILSRIVTNFPIFNVIKGVNQLQFFQRKGEEGGEGGQT